MKTNLTIEISDPERQALASFLDGKPTARLATRDDVRSFCQGIVEGVCDSRRVGNLSEPAPADKFEDLIARNIKEQNMSPARAKSYRRGWTMKPFRR